jgi:hypothetical protein
MTYQSELRGKYRAFCEIRDRIMPEIAQLGELLGMPGHGDRKALLRAADFLTVEGADISDADAETIAATLRRIASREGE